MSYPEIDNAQLNAFLEVFADVAEQKRVQSGETGPLAGLKIAVKDNILIKGRISSSGSKILSNYIASYDATVIKKLREAGAVFVGRTNMDEFAMGASTENSAYGVTKNPHDLSRVAGGSSGGSAAVVAAGLADAALGSDTGGSIRQPASFCGVVGLKPTYGRVSRFGLTALASSLDQIGPIAKTVNMVEKIYQVIAGYDENDATSVDAKFFETKKDEKLKIGVPRHLLASGVDPEVLQNFEDTLKKLARLGHEVIDIELPAVKYAIACYYIIMPAEASTNLSRFDGLRYGLKKEGENLLDDYLQTRGTGFGSETRRRIILGTYVLSSGYYDAYYGQATRVRGFIKQDFVRAFQRVDAIALPTAPTTAFKIGEKANDPLQMYLADVFTSPANLAGLPAISIPSGKDSNNLPIGFQLIAPPWREDRLFALGLQIES
ncbi:Asp-tRNA(Asn)/Glu-tRNA(Gln) amidotransferase subunit GatA [Candidatus Nomurabacteria bacterium]|nr:Asp-tRNA(Asn)/Glu-tRNA(Gln) amidotransferase subunit GatA [Candidatus Nomurabacteria bacterium]